MEVNLTRKDNEVTVKFVGRMDTPAALEAAKELEPLKEDPSISDGDLCGCIIESFMEKGLHRL